MILDLATWSSTGSGSQTDVSSPSVLSEEAALPASVAVPASAQASAGSQANRNLVDARYVEFCCGWRRYLCMREMRGRVDEKQRETRQ